MLKKIAIFGGAFNPIHKAHIEIAKIASISHQAVWIMPCFSHVHGKNMAPAMDRLAMCRLGITSACTQFHSPVYVSSYEIDNELSGGTYETLLQLKKDFSAEFSVIIGQDNADTINTWRNWEKLINEFSFFVVPRLPFSPLVNAWYQKDPHIYENNCFVKYVPTYSSTQAREEIRQYRKTLVPPTHLIQDVIDYIIDKNLYAEEEK